MNIANAKIIAYGIKEEDMDKFLWRVQALVNDVNKLDHEARDQVKVYYAVTSGTYEHEE